MFLRRATITGFKSFANKTVLELEPGITAVVGPNGSGKSNLADAVRWALGEQSKSRLRLSDREEVVFAGTQTRAKASYAEVILLFDNEDGAFPLELAEVEISRRMYRSGETDYRLAGRSARLVDIQAHLARAGFGANSYAVIGQGMIDSLLLSSPAERKMLFGEAAGIRGPELGREAAERKLAATSTNLVRLRDIAAELGPRLATLERAVSAATQRQTLEAEVARLRTELVGRLALEASESGAAAHEQHEAASAQTRRLQDQLASLARQMKAGESRAAAAASKRAALQTALAALEQARDESAAALAEARAAAAVSERATATATELAAALRTIRVESSAATAHLGELDVELASNAESAAAADRTVERTAQLVADAQAALVALRHIHADGTRDQFVDHALQILKTLAISLADDPNLPTEQVKLLVHKAGRLLSHATRSGANQLLDDLKASQKKLEAAMHKRETAIEHQTNIIITSRSLEIDRAHQQNTVDRLAEDVVRLTTEAGITQITASQLPGLKRVAAKAQSSLDTAITRLEARRDALRDLAGSDDVTEARIKLAADIERTKAAAATATALKERCQADVAAATASAASAAARADSWHIDLPAATRHAPAARTVLDLEADLLRAESRLEAQTAAAQDQELEYTEVSTRHADLTAQISDLEHAQTDLVDVIGRLDELIRTRFRANFQSLAEQFSLYFTRLFSGGTASLELTEDETGAYGITIKASPKGKRLSNIAALSGGERALAGVALLAAILRVNPSPFVVLDEIDAALDEANSGRLAAILAELSEHSQLIVITHNHQTMSAARVLFGVTTSEHHVSRLISMRLGEATRLAAR